MYEEMNDNILKRERKFDIIPLLVFVGLYIVESIAQSSMAAIFGGNVEGIRYSIVWVVGKLLPLLIAIVIYRKRFGELIGNTKKGFGKFILFTIISFFVFYGFELGSSYYQLLMNKLFNLGEAANQQTILDLFTSSNNPANYVLLFINIVILAPLLEEFEYRELIFKTFKGFHFLIPSFISALLFGLAHTLQFILSGEFNQVYFLPVYMLPGFCLSLIYHYSNNNFYCSYLVHLTSNLISFMVIISEISQGAPTVEI